MNQPETTLYDPMVKKTFIPVIPFFNHLFRLKLAFTGMKVLDLVILHSYMILEFDLKRSYAISMHSLT